MNLKTLRRFEYLWSKNPLWLMHLQGIPDPRRFPDRAIHAARLMLAPYQIEAVGEARVA